MPQKVQKVPTRTNLIRQFFGLSKDEDLRPYIEQLKKKLTKEDKADMRKLKKIQKVQPLRTKKEIKTKYYKNKAIKKERVCIKLLLQMCSY